jgi:hypothetical protein
MKALDGMRRKPGLAMALVVWASLLGLYLATAATGIVPGDPTEYTFVAHMLGIAHPPGYAFMTLLTKLWQTVVPLGTIAQRSHWLAAVAGALTSALVLGAVWQIEDKQWRGRVVERAVPAVLGGLVVGVAADHWQHSIHINSHIITVTLNAAAIFLLLRWWRTEKDRWLYGFCVVAGVGPTHHPLTVFSLPAFALFIVAVRPGLLQITSKAWWREKRWRTVSLMALCGLVGLSVWLYYPIRSPMEPAFGPADMNTLNGFLNVALARGLRSNLFHFGLAEQGQRLLVFWTLLRQQFALPALALAALGAGWLARFRWRPLLLLGLTLLVNLTFIINTVQDVMAYLLTPFMVVGLLAGVGGLAVVDLARRLSRRREGLRGGEVAAVAVALLVWPVLGLVANTPRISLRGYEAGDRYVEAVEARFTGRGEGATLLNDWEHMTPLWYREFVDGRWPAPEDVVPSLVSPDRPWLERVFEHLPGGPVYLSDYRREVVDAGFRLRPDGPFYEVVEPGDRTVPAGMDPVPAVPAGQPLELVGYRLADREVPAGGLLSLDLAMRTPISLTDYLVPYVQVGEIDYAFTTDSHLLTPLWQPGEVIVERFEMALPLDLEPASLPLRVGIADLSSGERSEAVSIGQLAVAGNVTGGSGRPEGRVWDRLLANFGQRVGVDRVVVRAGGERRTAVWKDPIALEPGDPLEVVIRWRCLASIEESYTVFVHLMDAGNQVWDQTDYTPLGGSYPTHLWIPKWLAGQTALDPYRLTIPAEAPPGDYYVEIGLYAMTSQQRIYQYDQDGDLVGDRLVLGPIRVGDLLNH